MAGHSPTPWSTGLHPDAHDDTGKPVVMPGLFDAHGLRIADYISNEDMYRVAACVNALAGIEDPGAFVQEAHNTLVIAVLHGYRGGFKTSNSDNSFQSLEFRKD